jgi:ferredoxin
MMHGVSNALQEAGMPKDASASSCSPPASRSTEHKPRAIVAGARHQTEVTVIMDGSHASFTMDKDKESILDAGLRAGIDMRYSCKGGVCSTCRCKVLEGKVDMDVNYALEDYEVARGFVLSCQSFPVTDKVVVDFDQARINDGHRKTEETPHDLRNILFEIENGIAVADAEPPRRLNSFTQAMHREVRDALDSSRPTRPCACWC